MKGTRIIIAEDDALLSGILEVALRDIGVVALLAPDGQAALALLRENPDIPILLTDVRMPKMDGYQLVRKALAEFVDIKVVMMTGFADERPPSEVMTAREFRFLRKPVAVGVLQSLIAEMLSRP